MTNLNKLFPDGVALVIGGSGGTGQAICMALAKAGTDVALTYRTNKDKATEVCTDIESLGQKASAYSVTIGEAYTVEQAVANAIKDHGRIHTVVIAAGSDIKQPLIAEMTREQWQHVIDQDLNGFFNVVHATLPHLKENDGGSYVHISSAGLLRWPKRDALSVAPKAAIESLITGIAKEEGCHKIRANSVALGVIETGIFLRLKEEGVFTPEWESEVIKDLALKRFGKPEEVADAAVFLASNKATYITGQMISVAGGYGL